MGNKIKLGEDQYKCPNCDFIWDSPVDLEFDENERVACCPVCGELIEDVDDEI